MSHNAKPLPAPKVEYDFENENQFRRTVETNFQDVYSHIEGISHGHDHDMIGEMLKYQFLFLGA